MDSSLFAVLCLALCARFTSNIASSPVFELEVFPFRWFSFNWKMASGQIFACQSSKLGSQYSLTLSPSSYSPLCRFGLQLGGGKSRHDIRTAFRLCVGSWKFPPSASAPVRRSPSEGGFPHKIFIELPCLLPKTCSRARILFISDFSKVTYKYFKNFGPWTADVQGPLLN